MYERNEAHQEWLETLLGNEGAVAGSVHVQRGGDLFLTAAHNLPPHVVAIVARVPHGKGMAGAAQVQKGPVQTCNLKTDDNVKPGAKAVDAKAGVALPVLDPNGEVRAVVGMAWNEEGALDPAREQSLMQSASRLPL
jgi:hypothetical protein